MSVIIPRIISRLRLGFEWVQVPIPTLPIPTLPIPTVPNTNSNPNCNRSPNPIPNSNPNPLHYPFRNVGIAVVGIAAVGTAAASRFELLFIL